jgi:hypothetical protein
MRLELYNTLCICACSFTPYQEIIKIACLLNKLYTHVLSVPMQLKCSIHACSFSPTNYTQCIFSPYPGYLHVAHPSAIRVLVVSLRTNYTRQPSVHIFIQRNYVFIHSFIHLPTQQPPPPHTHTRRTYQLSVLLSVYLISLQFTYKFTITCPYKVLFLSSAFPQFLISK